MLKRKTMARAEWTGIEARSYVDAAFAEGDMRGRVGLMRMDRVDEPFFVTAPTGGKVCVTHEGYSWLQLAPQDEHFWATAMFDENGKFIQCYFDITLENHPLPRGESWFVDLLLDYVLYPDGMLQEYDRDELEAACRQGAITEAQYALALEAGDRLRASLDGRAQRFIGLCAQYRNLLMTQMKGEELS